jgi:hypothetical protein
MAEYAFWDPKRGKPDLFAPGEVRGTDLEELLRDPDLRGSSFAALQTVFAAILLWASRRSLRAGQVRELLEQTASAITPAKPKSAPVPRRLDLSAALNRVRQDLIGAALSQGPLPFPELVAACSLTADTTLRLIGGLTERGLLRQFNERGLELYEWIGPAR